MSAIIGIDLGTTNSVGAVIVGNRPRLIPVDGERLLPSCVGLSPEGRLIVGHQARNQWVTDPDRTILSVKRKMGRPETVRLGPREYTPQEISSFILRKIKLAAEDYLGETVDRAVITVPASFGDAQRRATQEAGELAGLAVARIINEPTAAALAFGVNSEDAQFLAVYDLGGGTFDISVIEMQSGVIEVLSSVGDDQLGGDDFDQALVRFFLDLIEAEEGVKIQDERVTLARLRRAAEDAKMRLSVEAYTTVREEFLATGTGSVVHLETELSRQQFESLIAEHLLKTRNSLKKALNDAHLKPDQMRRILLVGGSTRIPLVSRIVQETVGIPPSREVHPDEAVALGAAIQAAIIEGKEVQAVLVDVAPHSLGIEVVQEIEPRGLVEDDVMSTIIRRNTPIPCSMTEEYSTHSDQQRSVEIKVFQGEHPVASENELLTSFSLKGLRPGRAGEPSILVRFDYDASGIVHIQARDKDTGSQEECVVKIAHSKLTEARKKRVQSEMPQIEARSEPLSSSRSVLERAKRMLDAKSGALADTLREATQTLEKAIRDGDEEFAREIEDRIVDLMYELEW